MFGYDHFAMGMLGPGMILFWGLLIVLVVVALRAFTGRSDDRRTDAPSALEVLKARYARGEIDDAEYRRRRIELEK
jgi:putative membrane protein